jgi:hypothetical protein
MAPRLRGPDAGAVTAAVFDADAVAVPPADDRPCPRSPPLPSPTDAVWRASRACKSVVKVF